MIRPESAQVTSSTARPNPPTRGPARRAQVARRWLRLATATAAAATAGSVLVLGSPGPLTERGAATPVPASSSGWVPASPTLRLVSASAHRWPGHPGRRLVRYRVRPGDTATGLAVRFHAWTRELRSLNHLGSRGRLYVGEHVRIPVVLAAIHQARRQHASRHARHRVHAKRHHPRPAHLHPEAALHTSRHHRAQHRAHHRRPHPWRQADASRATVRRVIVRTARRHDMEPASALAIAWQESGWQQRRISPAGAIGALQVMPDTGRWMSTYVDRRLNLYSLHDNVTAGVVLFRVLRGQTSWRRSVAAYYQGLGALQEHGMYRDTKRYTRNVAALRHRLRHGWNPS